MIALLLFLADAPAQMPMPAFLSGCWTSEQDGEWTEECWSTTRGGMMLGSARSGRGDRVTMWEWMRIDRGADGKPTFHASPKGVPSSAFPAVRATATEFEVINAAHDYPQRIVYRRTADGLEAEISLADGSKASRWSYRRSDSPTR